MDNEIADDSIASINPMADELRDKEFKSLALLDKLAEMLGYSHCLVSYGTKLLKFYTVFNPHANPPEFMIAGIINEKTGYQNNLVVDDCYDALKKVYNVLFNPKKHNFKILVGKKKIDDSIAQTWKFEAALMGIEL